ncbi:MAG: sigma-54-dependent Fis family transcriptional regulator [Planctomycetes bacterium]|nr:sigma-54-dependent Fis family transcriptional regulator [Planctomycetota bacterium]
MPRLLLCDDDAAVRDSVRMTLSGAHYEIEEAATGPEAIASFEASSPDAVLLDIKMPGMDGIEVLEKLIARNPDACVIMVSAHGTVATAVECTRKGAFDFLEKPLDRDRLLLAVKNALSHVGLRRENRALRERLRRETVILGGSAAIREVLSMIDRVARTDARVLITGENGTGKELVARAIHERSDRASGPFVDVNCAALPGELIESELFGHEPGAYTGAQTRYLGRFEQAKGGTLFLDEIGDMPPAAQAKVLRVLEEGQVQRLGSGKNQTVDVRVLAATNQDLPAKIGEKQFREDLYFRLNVFPMAVPPLRARREDIPILASHFLAEFCRRHRLPARQFAPEALQHLSALEWPGNVRELRNTVERVAIVSDGPTIDASSVRRLTTPLPPGVAQAAASADPFAACRTFEEFKGASERLFIEQRLKANAWNISKTADAIDMPRSNLYKKMEKYGLK